MLTNRNDYDTLARELMEYFEEYKRQKEQRRSSGEMIYMYDTYSCAGSRYRVWDTHTSARVVAYRYLERIVGKIANHFGHTAPLVAVHHSHRQNAFYVDVYGNDPTIIMSIEELTNHPVGAIWTCLHEYMHYVQRMVVGYLVPIQGNIFYALYKWKGKEVRINLLETEHYQIPWEAEADSFANTNIGFFLNEFGYTPDQFENPLPVSRPEHVKIRVQPNFNVERKQPEFWYYNSENSGCL